MTAPELYQEFRENFEYDAGEPELPIWEDLSAAEKDRWYVYAGEANPDGDHGDPAITQHNKPRR